MVKNKITANLKINPNDFLVPLERTLIECSSAVFTGLAILDNLKELPESIYGEDNFMMHKPYGANMSIDQRKEIFKNWLIRKGFEDLIRAITATLISVCNMLKLNNKFKDPMTFKEFKNLLSTQNFDMTKSSLPELLALIKPNLTSKLTYENEIRSINRARNCLVHRNGFITPFDFTNNKKSLILKWVFLKLLYFESGKEEEINQMMLLTDKGEIKITQTKRSQEFKENERIEISYQLFNELIYTCILFGKDLISKLKF